MRQFTRRLVPIAFSLVVLASGVYVPTHRPLHITIHADGTFDPPTLEIDEGDRVIWTRVDENGNNIPFATTDSITRIGLPGVGETKEQVCGATAGGASACISQTPEVNFSGPKRKGISGIHVLGPQGYGNIETSTPDLSATCNDVLNPDHVRGVYYYTVITATDTLSGTQHLLCTKRVFNRENETWEPAADKTQGHISQIVPSVWDNPDIDGVVLRVRWKDFQYYDGTSVVTVWDDIDRAFREAIKRGKMVSINIHAGVDTPEFIFNDYVPQSGPRPAESNVVPVSSVISDTGGITVTYLQDYGSDPITPDTSGRCGTEFKIGSPTDPNYVAKIKGLYSAVADHVKADARFFQSLGYVKVSGLNLFTGEARLPKRCLPGCPCNTEIWANATHRYTPTGLYTYYNDIENQIFSEFMGEKSLHYMLIQAGFPQVNNEHCYLTMDEMGEPRGTICPGSIVHPMVGGTEQTENVLEYGRLGRFAQPGDPTLLSDDLATGKLFVAQHSALSLHPMDNPLLGHMCPQTASHVEQIDANGKKYHDVYTDTTSMPPLRGDDAGCPNEWAVKEGYRGQLIGFQTTNQVDTPNEVDSSLWNMMSASNAAYYEIYEKAAWVIAKQKGTGPNAAVLDYGYDETPDDTIGYFPDKGTEYQKNLNQWGQQLHQRRERLASLNSTYLHMADPFPAAHSHRFSEPLDPGEVRDFYYIDPGRCMLSQSAQPFGHIRVIGQ